LPARDPAPHASGIAAGNEGDGWVSVSRHVVLSPPRSGIAVLAVLSRPGLQALRRHGHAHVADRCAPGVPAAQVRLVDMALAAGLARADDAGLLECFDAPWPRLPVLTGSVAASPSGVTAHLRIPPDLHALRGHFAAMPIVPGAVQVGWAIDFARQLLGVSGDFVGLDATKFRRIVQPGHLVELALEWYPERRELRFEYRSEGLRSSLGRIRLGATDA